MRNCKKNNIDYDKLARFAKALSHPVRVQILEYLHQNNSCFTCELVKVLPFAQSTVSQHLKELKDAGLIKGEINPPRVRYCIDEENWMIAKKIFCGFFKFDFYNKKNFD